MSISEGAATGRASNISAGGIFVRTERRFATGAVLALGLELPDGGPPASVRARVVHAVPPVRVHDAGLGMQFVATGEAFRVRLDRYIDSIASKCPIPVKLLLVARDLLHESGWTQFVDHVPGGSYCLTGALSRAAGDDREGYVSALESVGRRLAVPPCPHGGYRCHCAVLKWNDQEGRTKRDVIAKLDEVINDALGSAA